MKRLVLSLALAVLAAGCATKSELPAGPSAYQIVPADAAPVGEREYLIGPLDRVTVVVFRQPDLSVQDAQVDSAGKLALPLLGAVSVHGKTAEAVAAELRTSLQEYVKNPVVSVAVNSITQKVVVEGSVNQPGVYDIRGSATLIEAIAMARSPTEVADLDQVFVFRTIGGRVQGARFDLRRIRAGLDPDPAIVAGDRVVVGLDHVADAWRRYVERPIFNTFRFNVN
ncbi:MAG: polysaccharide biosynthesis/export family protein [Erythrobacter sp.]|nr:polysaccharide biosynthesis/export family protein [Erythrobacter sp.]